MFHFIDFTLYQGSSGRGTLLNKQMGCHVNVHVCDCNTMNALHQIYFIPSNKSP